MGERELTGKFLNDFWLGMRALKIIPPDRETASEELIFELRSRHKREAAMVPLGRNSPGREMQEVWEELLQSQRQGRRRSQGWGETGGGGRGGPGFLHLPRAQLQGALS